MLIDPFTVVAQLVNFAILLLALRWLLFDRVVRAMDEREAAIAGRIRDADERAQTADERDALLQARLADLEQAREGLLSEARDEARQRRDELTAEAEREVETQRARWWRALERERERAVEDVRREVGEQVVGLSSQVLRDLADASLERQIVATFVRRLEGLDGVERDEVSSWVAGARTVVVASTAELADDDRARLEAAVRTLGAAPGDIVFELDADLVCGIELRADGQALAWTVDDYLGRFSEAMAPLLHRDAPRG